jgi:signal transduction histidine kinase
LGHYPDVNVIVLTGLADKVIGINAVKAGAQDFLMKGGFDAELLAKTLRYSIDRKHVLRRLAESQKAQEVAEESARLKEQFIASISHEMRTPMNAIYGMSNLIAQTNLNSEQRNYIDSIKQSSEILLGVINDILEISTLQNGQMEFEAKDFDLTELLYNMVNVMQYKKNEKNLSFTIEIAPDVPRFICADKLRLNQILYNIVGNAVKFTDYGFVRIGVEIKFVKAEEVDEDLSVDGSIPVSEIDKPVLCFVVEDSGIGIPSDKVDSIFGAFTRIRTKDRIFEGTGLGLAIVKNLVQQQGGTIGATSVRGEGTTIGFELPIQLASSQSLLVSPDAPIPIHQTDKKRAFSLLLVEDHKMNQMVARMTLEKHFENINITIANHGQEAIDILQTGAMFDIIMMDIQMPVMDGNETTAYIRKKMPEIKTPILAMTAHAYISKDNIFKNYGFDDFVLKPFDPEQLFYKIYKFISHGDN